MRSACLRRLHSVLVAAAGGEFIFPGPSNCGNSGGLFHVPEPQFKHQERPYPSIVIAPPALMFLNQLFDKRRRNDPAFEKPLSQGGGSCTKLRSGPRNQLAKWNSKAHFRPIQLIGREAIAQSLYQNLLSAAVCADLPAISVGMRQIRPVHDLVEDNALRGN